MAFFVIAGKANCAHFLHAMHVAKHLNENLPRFKYKDIEIPEKKWDDWLDVLNAKNKWRMTTSPVIWKEISIMGGKPYLIGNLGEFWEYCYDYYGFQSFHSYTDIKAVLAEYEFIMSKIGKPPPKCNVITIYGGWKNPRYFSLMLHSVHDAIKLGETDTILFKIYDIHPTDLDAPEELLYLVEELSSVLARGKIEISNSLIDSVQGSDLVLVLKNFERRPEEAMDEWLQRCQSEMYLLAEEVNYHAQRNLRIILCHPGPVCFTASVLVKNITSIRLANIVAVTTHKGLGTIDFLSRRTGIPVEEISCPPVWGFVGIKSYIDVGSIVLKGEIYRPFARALKSTETSKLPKGRIKTELRLMNCFLDNEEKIQMELMAANERLSKKTDYYRVYSRVRATTSLIRIWQTGEPFDDIISLGVCSNGSFGFKSGIVFSQPVILNDKRFWEPFSNFPQTSNVKLKISEMSLDVNDIIKKYKLGSDFN